MYSADPNSVKNAKLLKEVSYNEMLEAASSGAKVLHNRAVSMAKKYKLKVLVKNTKNNTRGSEIIEDAHINEIKTPKILAVDKELVKITLVGEELTSNLNVISELYIIAKENNIVFSDINFSETKISIVVKRDISDVLIDKIHKRIIENV